MILLKNRFNLMVKDFPKIWFFLGLIVFTFFYQDFLELLTNSTLLSFETHYTKDISVLALFVIILLYAYKKPHIVPNGKYWKLFYLLFILGYVFLRLGGVPFLGFWCFNKVKIFDTLALIFVIFLFYKPQSIPENKNEGLLDDLPTSIDELGYDEYAKNLVSWIVKTKSSLSFAIGINAKWGAGKTTFFQFIKKDLEKHKILFLDFKPWFSKDDKSIVHDFFDKLAKNIQDIQLKSKLNSYAYLLRDNSKWQNFVEFLKYFVLPSSSLQDLFDDIKYSLIHNNKKVVVFIDDTDRLEGSEIFEVLRLIRNVANFPNLFFVVAYDKAYVSSVLNSQKIFNSDYYLQKIFQVEISLPAINKNTLVSILLKELIEIVEVKFHDSLRNELVLDPKIDSETNYIFEWIENKRDINQLVNSFKINYLTLKDDVRVIDFLRLEILRINYPDIYYSLGSFRNRFVNNEAPSLGRNYYSLSINDKIVDKIQNECNHKTLSQSEIQKIENLLILIFKADYDQRNDFNSIIWPERYHRYFSFQLEEDAISNKEFLSSFGNGSYHFLNQLNNWLNAGKHAEIEKKLAGFKPRDAKEFEFQIFGIFNLGNYLIDDARIIGFNLEKLFEILNDSNQSISNKFYRGNTVAYMDYLISILKNAQKPYLFYSEFLFYLITQSKTISPLLDENKIHEIIFDYFQSYLQSITKFDKTAIQLFHCTQRLWKIGDSKQDFESEEYVFPIQNALEYEKYKLYPVKSRSYFKNFILNEKFPEFVEYYSDLELFKEIEYFNIKMLFENIFGTKKSIVVFKLFKNNNISKDQKDNFINFLSLILKSTDSKNNVIKL